MSFEKFSLKYSYYEILTVRNNCNISFSIETFRWCMHLSFFLSNLDLVNLLVFAFETHCSAENVCITGNCQDRINHKAD